MTFPEICRHFQAKKIGKGKYQAKCPAHRDSSPSLSIREGQRAALVKCWAGCELEAILRASNIGLRDLWYEQTADPKAVKAAQRKRDEEEWSIATLKAYRILRQERVWMWYRLTAAFGWLLMKNPGNPLVAMCFNTALEHSREAPYSWPNPVPQTTWYCPFPPQKLLHGITPRMIPSYMGKLLKLKS